MVDDHHYRLPDPVGNLGILDPPDYRQVVGSINQCGHRLVSNLSIAVFPKGRHEARLNRM
jgi:hypothetical protein